jgi:hypothetical protein
MTLENKLTQKIHIIGSCVTRDIFRILEKDHLVGKYSARSSLISRVSPPLKVGFDSKLVSLNSNWQQKMVKQDFEKTGICLDEFYEGILIIDFIDERLKLLRIGDTFVTESTELLKLDLESILQPNEILSRGSHQDFDLWLTACNKFTEIIPKQIRDKTILHKAFWANQYIENGQIKNFEDHKKIEFFNNNLLYYYDTFQSIYKPGTTIEIESKKRLADANHRWNLAAFHYVPEYYKECWRQVLEFSSSQLVTKGCYFK